MIRRDFMLRTSLKLMLLRAKEEWDQKKMSRRTGRVPPGRLAKLLCYLYDANQLLDKDWEVLQYLEFIFITFETVVKTLEGDGQIRTRQSGWQGSYGNIWDVVVGTMVPQLCSGRRRATQLPCGLAMSHECRWQ
jgi:hypothetical protein